MTRRALGTGIAAAVAGAVAIVAITIALTPGSPSAQPRTGPAVTGAPGPGSSAMVGVTVREVDGGADFFARFEGGLPASPGFFPIAVWFASVTSRADVRADARTGINAYVELTANSDVSLITHAGMHAIPSVPAEGAAGLLVADEVDMWAGPGDGVWTGAYPGEGDVCLADVACGYSIMAELTGRVASGTMTVANFGKGVAFWETDAEARPFLEYTDVVSADTYWFTDPNICGATEGGWGPGDGEAMSEQACRLAANYGWTVEHVRSLVEPPGSKPVWSFVEVGQPFGDSGRPAVTGPQIRAAVWSGIIHGARGVVYFNHSFGGGCASENVLRDACGDEVRSEVTALNAQLTELAPTLNAPFVDGLVEVGGDADVAVKLHDGGFTVIAGSTRQDLQQVEFTSGCRDAATADVLGEDRSIPVTDGRFSDEFADGDAVHLYRLDGGSCGL
ncbi:hypothetical protein [Agromyces ramosus]|uniref:Uncharacterized protein n=1 Tax=Agromyces ramosus TaxID=33879 RepID=A0ABU0RAQ2_9MICO|nr:hypothetical protein [Agromyces ramosus]MDQ0894281.1 hypothetical protein [Agromyces ramosus]